MGGPGQRRALLQPYLGGDAAHSFLNRVRLADIALKGSQSILPRAERMANAFALDVRVPLFDRALAEASFALPPSWKLHGASEKHVLKLALQAALPSRDCLAAKVRDGRARDRLAAGPAGAAHRGAAGPGGAAAARAVSQRLVERLRRGEDLPGETRRRRIGERLWAL